MKYNSKVKTIIAVIYYYSMGRNEGKKKIATEKPSSVPALSLQPPRLLPPACRAGRLDISPV